MRAAPIIKLGIEKRKELEQIRTSRSSPFRLRERAAIVLLADEGLDIKDIAERLGQDKMKAGR